MGLSLASAKASKKKNHEDKKSSAGKGKSLKLGKRKKDIEEVLEEDDELVTVDEPAPITEEPKVSATEVKRVGAFQLGHVHPDLDGAVNTHWRRSCETSILWLAMTEGLLASNAFVGAIAVKTSFVGKKPGSALL